MVSGGRGRYTEAERRLRRGGSDLHLGSLTPTDDNFGFGAQSKLRLSAKRGCKVFL